MAERNSIPAKTVGSVTKKLEEISVVLLALNELASTYDEHNSDGISGSSFATVVESMSKQGVQMLDACMVRLGASGLGCFSDEFEGARPSLDKP